MSSKEVGIEEARKRLGDLVTAAQQGTDIILTRNGKPAARIVCVQEDTMPRPLVTDNALRYEPEGADVAFTWVRRDSAIGAQPYIYVWPKGKVGSGEPIAQLDVWKWNSQEQAPTTLDGHDDFVKRCDGWLAARD
ncbi:type II toxin-antitoxin system Phd/YefM family antitoxin [Micromonospora sp. 4G55]|uniref:type II toxin-antitoxin system Phd/YefM family antitoxin n=1 Tax=Micromonospora sp. 4G55 TaxID=2806102 RepID=UPI001A4F0D55|nr:type II toxin-antitoxin system Phd/YefM family antitoxin [Micromonospora sp. 4G55]MBM0257036.1 type II toxin-antitoxin system Phd/YefM family antitoxin [Micromonospora sp. 4G55]